MAGNFVHPANAFYNDVSRTACLVACSPAEGKDNKTAGGHEETVADHHQGTLRYLAYAARAKALLAIKAKAAGAHLIQVTGGAASGGVRYLAFTSDVGEAVRPVVSRTVVNATYAVAIAYMVGDVAYNGYQYVLLCRLPASCTDNFLLRPSCPRLLWRFCTNNHRIMSPIIALRYCSVVKQHLFTKIPGS
jgi:hypothetical protein